jgi:DNA mismatch repair protein MutS
LAEDFSRIKNFNVSVKELDNKVVFLRKLKEGGSEHSFGIHVAQIAGMPQSVVLRANEILHHLEKDHIKEDNKERIREAPRMDIPKNNFQLSFFEPADPKIEELKAKLKAIDVNTLSPIEALLKLNDLVKLV